MSNLDRTPALSTIGGRSKVVAAPVKELFAGREVSLGGTTMVRRLLPNLGRRLVGPWCFVDHYGPDNIAGSAGMRVPPHPHIGLQTVSWLLDGQVLHRDSLGSNQLIQPGELGLMTAGSGIAHAENSPVPHAAFLHGVQLWLALPDGQRGVAPSWQHETNQPVWSGDGLRATVIMGELDGVRSTGRAFSPLLGADVELTAAAAAVVPLEPDFEYAVLTMAGALEIEGVGLTPGAMLYLGCGRREVRLASTPGARVLLLGGEPFDEQIVMWWNFVARSAAEIEAARDRWVAGDSYGSVVDAGDPTPAPPLPAGRLQPGGAVRRRNR